MPSDRDRIRAYYATLAEPTRLGVDTGWLERARTLELLRELPPGRLLDLGGADGVYAIPMARAGHAVTLVDLSPDLVALARDRAAAAGVDVRCLVGDAAALPVDGPFDAVLCAGPLYHAASERGITRVLSECARVLKPGGRLLGAVLPRLTAVSGLVARAAAQPAQVPSGTLTRAWETGRFVNPEAGAFTDAWFAEPRHLVCTARGLGFSDVHLLSLRGIAAPYGSEARQLRDSHPALFAEVLELIRRTEAHPGAVHMGHHAMLVATRAEGPSWLETDWDGLHRDDLHALARLRQEVFVVEQACAYADLDGRDPAAIHLIGFDADGPVAYARLFGPGEIGPDASIGRVIVHPRARGTGLGHTLMREARSRLERRLGPVAIHLSAQAHLEGFYGSLGYRTCGPGYDEDGIPHLPMRLERG